jgi:glucosamine kinase
MSAKTSGGMVFCVDAGGTRCRGRIVAGEGRNLGEAEAGPCNPATDLARATASLIELWARCARAAGLDAAAPGAVTLALGGAGLGLPEIRARFLAGLPRFARVTVMSDGYAALIGAGGGRPCGLIIVGTGVAGHRLFPDGSSILRDGWGWVGGDRGSGAWLGLRALRHALAALDGIVPRDGLAASVLEALGDPRVWLIGVGPDRLGALAPLVLAAAERGDAAAEAIVARGAAHLAALAGALALGAEEALYLSGGLADVMRPRVAARLGHAIALPEADARTGCWLVATGAAPPERLVGTTEAPA